MTKVHVLILCNQKDCKYCKEPYQKICSLDKDEKGKCCHPQPKLLRSNCIQYCESKNEKLPLPEELQTVLNQMKNVQNS